jgi:hypothetical protein
MIRIGLAVFTLVAMAGRDRNVPPVVPTTVLPPTAAFTPTNDVG